MATRFLGFEQSPVAIADRTKLEDFLARHPQELTGYSFATLVAWSKAFQYEWSFADADALLVSCVVDPDPNRHLIQPVGKLSPALVERIVREARSLSYPLRVIGVGDRFLEENRELLAHFDVIEDRAMTNYVYRASDLAELRGARYAKKRNLLAQAASLYHWTVEPLTPDRIGACFEVLRELDEHETSPAERTSSHEQVLGASAPNDRKLCEAPLMTVLEPEKMFHEERAALELTLKHFAELRQEGVLVSVEGKPSAFAIFEPLDVKTAVVHFERAARSRKGLYQVVNKLVAQAIAAAGFELINREEDVGDPGLRQAKSSYHPSHLANAWMLTFSNGRAR
jgi:hypothetical protein